MRLGVGVRGSKRNKEEAENGQEIFDTDTNNAEERKSVPINLQFLYHGTYAPCVRSNF